MALQSVCNSQNFLNITSTSRYQYQSPASVASVASAIGNMADAIVTKAAQKAKVAIENAACSNSRTKPQSAFG